MAKPPRPSPRPCAGSKARCIPPCGSSGGARVPRVHAKSKASTSELHPASLQLPSEGDPRRWACPCPTAAAGGWGWGGECTRPHFPDIQRFLGLVLTPWPEAAQRPGYTQRVLWASPPGLAPCNSWRMRKAGVGGCVCVRAPERWQHLAPADPPFGEAVGPEPYLKLWADGGGGGEREEEVPGACTTFVSPTCTRVRPGSPLQGCPTNVAGCCVGPIRGGSSNSQR